MNEALARIFSETDARLRTSQGPSETREISLQHVAAVAAGMADTVYLAIGGASTIDGPAIGLIIGAYEGLLTSLTSSLQAGGIQATALGGELSAEAGRAFLDRLEALYQAPEQRGRA